MLLKKIFLINIIGVNYMIKCPHCDVVMNEALKQNIIIDVCPKCMGVWLDKGEMEKIVELYSNEESNFRPDNQKYKYDNNRHHDDDCDDHDEHGHGGNLGYDKDGTPCRKRGGISEIFGDLFG